MSTSTSLVTGVDFITVPTKDFDEAFEFYGEVLGLEFSKRLGGYARRRVRDRRDPRESPRAG